MSICLQNQTLLAFNNKGAVHSLDSSDTMDNNFDDQTDNVWLAQAEWFFSDKSNNSRFDSSNTNHFNNPKLQPQQQAVRLLLMQLIKSIRLAATNDDTITALSILDETSYPYRLKPFNDYVSFSHSQHSIACAVSRHSPIGIDLETRTVPLLVAKRFFHPIELAWLNALQLSERPKASQILWSIKEAFIKKNNFDNLIMGLKVNHVDLACKFIQQLRQQQQPALPSVSATQLNKLSCPISAFVKHQAEQWWLFMDVDETCLIMVK